VVPFYKYLGRIISFDDNDDQALTARLQIARKTWGRTRRLLCRQGAGRTTMARFYKVVVQAQLLYGSETWVPNQRCLQRLERFHARCARYLTHQHIQYDPLLETWDCPHTSEVLESGGLSRLSDLIAKRKTTLLHYAVTGSLLYDQVRSSYPNASDVWWSDTEEVDCPWHANMVPSMDWTL